MNVLEIFFNVLNLECFIDDLLCVELLANRFLAFFNSGLSSACVTMQPCSIGSFRSNWPESSSLPYDVNTQVNKEEPLSTKVFWKILDAYLTSKPWKKFFFRKFGPKGHHWRIRDNFRVLQQQKSTTDEKTWTGPLILGRIKLWW